MFDFGQTTHYGFCQQSAMYRRRYSIHRNDGVVWDLVFTPRAGWQVEQTGQDGSSVCIEVLEFEASATGKRWRRELANAIRAIENDD